MNDENQLLRAYAEEKSEPAFAELVRRYIDLVYSAALRQVNGNSSLAEDVTQSVFLDLARKAGSLTRHSSLAGWLFTTTRFIASNSLRHEMRRHAREQKAEIMIEQESEAAWQELRPVLDEAMHQLAEPDREAVLLRFFERQPLGAIGQRWGITENAARMRVERAIEKLRNALQKRGVTATALSLDGLLTARGTTAAPVGLTAKITAMRPGRHAALQPITTFRAARFGRVLGRRRESWFAWSSPVGSPGVFRTALRSVGRIKHNLELEPLSAKWAPCPRLRKAIHSRSSVPRPYLSLSQPLVPGPSSRFPRSAPIPNNQFRTSYLMSSRALRRNGTRQRSSVHRSV